MMKTTTSRWTTIVVLNVLAWSLFGGFRMCTAQSKGGQLPFSNSVEQRSEILTELREIKDLIREQNTILRDSGAKNAAKR
jgi:hypothetical protein